MSSPCRVSITLLRALLTTHDELFCDRYALHWLRWVAIADHGKLQEEFARNRIQIEARPPPQFPSRTGIDVDAIQLGGEAPAAVAEGAGGESRMTCLLCWWS